MSATRQYAKRLLKVQLGVTRKTVKSRKHFKKLVTQLVKDIELYNKTQELVDRSYIPK